MTQGYFYAPHRKGWGIWKGEGSMAHFIEDHPSRSAARDRVYELNGWKKKETGA